MSVGFFGKIPGHGDFVERGLTAPFKETWDEWLQLGISASQGVIGGSWLNTFLTSPVWRFALTAGICGPTGWVGVMLPSVDKVGRYFPLTIAAPVAANHTALQMLVGASEWHDAAQELGLAALHREDMDAASLERALAERCQQVLNQPPILCELSERDPREALHAHALCLPFTYGTTPGHGVLAFSHRLLEALFGAHHSIWWTHGSEQVHPGLFACARLPSPEAFAGMLADAYAAPGWIRLTGYALAGAADETGAPPAGQAAESHDDQSGAAGTVNDDAAAAAGSATATTQFDDLIQDAGVESVPQAPPSATVQPAPPDAVPAVEPDAVGPNDESAADHEPASPVAVSGDDVLAGIGGTDDEGDTARRGDHRDADEDKP